MLQPAAPNKLIIGLLALVKFLIPFVFIYPVFELQRDEYLYFEQGQHPALGYLENPPLLSWLGSISSLFGENESVIRFWPAFIGALTVIVTCLIAARLGGKSFAQFLAGFGAISGAFLRVHILFQPNILDIFFWTCSLYFLVRFIQTNKSKDLLFMAICLALAWWSKYSALFIIAAIVIGLLLTKHRKVFLQLNTYKVLGIALLIILPNFWWQYQHEWPLIHHMEELRETQLVHLDPMDFFKEQLLMLFPVLVIWIAGFIWVFRNSNYRIIGWIYLSVILLLAFGSAKGYYALGVYPVLIAAGSVVWENLFSGKVWMRFVITALVIGLTIPLTPLLLPTKSPEKLAEFYKEKGLDKIGFLKWEDQRDHELPQDFADMLGWREITERTENFFDSLPDSIKANTAIYGANYGQAGSMKFYGKNDRFKDLVISENGSFQLWIDDQIYFKHLIVVDDEVPDPDDDVIKHFEKVTLIDSVRNTYSRQFGDKIFFLENLDSTGLRFVREGFKENKDKFNR